MERIGWIRTDDYFAFSGRLRAFLAILGPAYRIVLPRFYKPRLAPHGRLFWAELGPSCVIMLRRAHNLDIIAPSSGGLLLALEA